MTAPLVRLRDVHLSVGGDGPERREVLAGVDLEISPGEQVGLVGPSGAGKTTLATVLAGLLEPTTGKAEGTSDVALVFQEPERGFFEETVLDDVAFGARNAGSSPEESRDRARGALRTTGLDPASIGSRAPETLSGGEARRAALAGVLVLDPRLLVLDEPTTGLDADGLDRLRGILDSLGERGVATLLVSHDLPFLRERCDRVLVLENGRITWEGPAAKLIEGAPSDWRDDPALGEGDLAALAEGLRARGVIDADPDSSDISSPESLAALVVERGRLAR